MTGGVPASPGGANGQGAREGTSRYLSVGNINYNESDIRALKDLAEVDPDLAKRVVDQKDEADKRDHASFRLGLIVAAVITTVAIVTVGAAIVLLGVIPSLIFIVALLIITVLVRAILTGQWSDASWIGRAMASIVNGLGGRPGGGGDAG